MNAKLKKIAVMEKTPICHERAVALSQQLQLDLVYERRKDFEFLLLVTPERLELHWNKPNAPGPLFVDFLSLSFIYRQKYGGGLKQLLAKAVGIKTNYKPTVLDATAGLGKDTFVLASLGCKVTMIERSKIIAVLIGDALKRAQGNSVIKNLHFISADACNFMQKLRNADKPDVVYLDPMFPVRTKSALVKKEMRYLREIVGEDQDAVTLLQVALQCAKKRVVVKRPRLAPSIDGPKPSLVMKGKSSRFDIYL